MTFAIGRPDFNGIDVGYKRIKPAKKEKDSALNVVLEQFSETGAASKILKTGRNALMLAARVPDGIPPQTELVSHINSFADTFEFLDIIKSTKELIKPSLEVKPLDVTKDEASEKRRVKREKTIRTLHQVKSGLGIVTSGIVGARLLDKFGAFKLANITASLGTIPVIGPAIPAVGTVYNVLATVKAVLEITGSSLKLVGLNESAKRIKDKREFWQYKIEEGVFIPSEPGFIEDRLMRLEQKKTSLATKAGEFQEKLVESQRNFDQKLEKYTESNTGKNKQALIKAARTQDAICDKIKALGDRHTGLIEKQDHWENVEEGYTNNEKAQLWKDKLNKWKVKAQHITKDKIKEGLNLATHIILVISLVASIIIAAIGLQMLIVAITISALFLLYSASSLTTHFVKRILDHQKKAHPIPKVAFPAAAA